ncbi:GSCFA domain-containing protein [Yoonia sp. 208BN28-4]|uniref:GSCFA domain-containing protein n=1 Tax=Yoonia sp. 208BN28-4 TaxID=3126505 RepID=UPI00309501A7
MNPYRSLPKKAFWKPAISERSFLDIDELYVKKFEIDPTDRIVTAGSCFAQHIARKLRERGYNYRDYEQAPAYFPTSKLKSYNFGVYSARYCNIYTTRQLLQTIERALGQRDHLGQVWEKDGGFVDPFRPVVEPVPYKTADEMLAARASHYRAVRRVIEESDIMVFTLGLTEAWIDKATGDVFPMCPGTQGGTFDPNAHAFANFGFAEVYDDLKRAIALLKGVNPGLKFLFTVSPVPLTATASDQHVLPATVYSKSVLRAVAGQIYQDYDFADYFPSFEVVSSHPFNGFAFEPNKREVNTKGVDFVMQHFFSQHTAAGAGAAAVSALPDTAGVDDDEAVCEEMLLEQEAAKWR